MKIHKKYTGTLLIFSTGACILFIKGTCSNQKEVILWTIFILIFMKNSQLYNGL